MLKSGLVSITFRPLSVGQVIEVVSAAGLDAIEWGGDVHVPPGAVEIARETAKQTRDAGLTVAAYGSYYSLSGDAAKQTGFERVLESAVALGAPTIRVWLGGKGSAETSAAERNAILADAVRIAELAAGAGIGISFEYHGGTLSDTQASVRQLLAEVTHPNIGFLWQPVSGDTAEESLGRLDDVLPRLHHVHVFHWWPTHAERHPLAEGEDRWTRYIEAVRKSGKPTSFLIEFVAGDSVEQFQADAATLRRWLHERG
jgi:3-dehydroshikimate dehydratase